MIPKFRAWWIQDEVMTHIDTLEFLQGGIRVSDGCWHEKFLGDEVILMQSTGLKDKNGTEIYEGDIVHVLDSEQINQRDENGAFIDAFFEEIDEIDSVVFADGSFKLKRTGFDVCICRSVDVFKIIGNIYENPELLEVP